MIAWANFAILLFSSLLFLYFYVRSVSPAGREMVVGPQAYEMCRWDRVIAIGFELMTTVNYVVYVFFPLPMRLPRQFPWPWWASILIALVIGIPAIALMVIGMRDAGEEALHPIKGQELFGGIYRHIRHPQAVGEVFLWWVIAFMLNSPFLVLFSFFYVPIFLILCWAEEQDLLLRYGKSYADYCRRTGAFFPKLSGENVSVGR
ncbi:MAG: methyltransferase family protein [Anaerolineales bacterium]